MVSLSLIVALVVLFIIVVLSILSSGIRIIQPYEQGLWVVLGRYKMVLNPGFHWVYPLISQVIRLDLRTQVLDVPRQEVITKDNSPTNVDAIIYIKVIDPKKAYFEVTNYRTATIYLAQTTLRSIIGDMELDEILSNRQKINLHLRDVLDEATDKWGVKVEGVEIREVDPAGKVKAAMEDQTSAERLRRAAILKADGSKRAAILNAEGEKRARILQAEGLRQAKILEAEGERLAIILRSQGDAQKLRILSLGASPLDSKALTVLSLDTLKAMGSGQATKIIFPFELTRLVEGASEYLGIGRQTPAREITKTEDLERAVGKVDKILGPIPTPEELHEELKALEKAMEAEKIEAEEIAEIAKKATAARKNE
ncbi:MAG: SPFH domain-containing protein [Thermoplasmata archaeon]|jgi:regulator of protease activity HflC (stomatin/prohibitin superfamily)|nr:SPFH domain-containing protein [Thermoplasmata archaeon]